jgi:hypothetical protein
MIERLAVAGTGLPTAYVGDKILHSRYDPAGEAEKYIAALNPHALIRFFILLEPGLGYMIPVLRRLSPHAKLIALHISDFFVEAPPASTRSSQTTEYGPAIESGAVHWSPGREQALQDFLEREIPDVGADAVRIIEWRPALMAYGSAYKELLAEAAAFIRRIDANVRTVRGFGCRWFRNFIRNTEIIRRPVRLSPSSRPWIITGAGPSLEEDIQAINELRRRDGAVILADSSSVPALNARKILPDLVISTDGGGWARFHLYETLRLKRPPLLAASFIAALPGQCAELPVLAISDGSLWQEAVLGKLGIPHTMLPQRGTVTAAALDLAFRCTGGAIILAGMDLSLADIRTHARPYAFDRFQEEQASRLQPRYSQGYVRSGMIASSGSHQVYAEWFGQQLSERQDVMRQDVSRLYSLGRNNPVFGKLRSPVATVPGTILDISIEAPVFQDKPAQAAIRLLTGLLEGGPGDLTEKLYRELTPLILPGEVEPSLDRLCSAITAEGRSHG